MQASTLFTYLKGMEGQVDLGVGHIPRWFTSPQTVTHPSSNHLIATRPSHHYATKPPVTEKMYNGLYGKNKKKVKTHHPNWLHRQADR